MRSLTIKNVLYATCPAPLRGYWDRVAASELGYRLARGAFWSLAGTVISRGLMLAAWIIVARILGREVFGEFGMIRSTVVLFGTFAGFGLGLTATKHVAEFRKSDPQRAGRMIALSGLVATVTGGVMAVILFLFAPWLAGHTLAAPHLSSLLRIGSLVLFFNALNGAQTGALAGLEAFKVIAKVSFLVGLVSFPMLVLGTYLGGLRGAVWALVVNLAVNWMLNHVALRREAARAGVPSGAQGSFQEWGVLWSFSLPAALSSSMVGPIHWVCGAMLVNQPGGYGELGILNAALTFQILLLFVNSTLDAPLLSAMCNAREHADDRLDRINILSPLLIGLIPVLPLLCLPEVAEFLFGKAYSGTSFTRTLALTLCFTCIMLYKRGLARVLSARNLLWWGFFSNVLWAVIVVFSAAYLVRWGAVGLAASFVLAYALNTLVIVPLYASQRLAPKGTLASKEAIFVWIVVGGLTAMTFFRVTIVVRAIGMAWGIFFVLVAVSRMWRRPEQTVCEYATEKQPPL